MKENDQAPEIKIMTLEFFARHFNFPIDSLAWGLVEVTPNFGQDHIDYAVLVKDKLLYIDIRTCKIRPCWSMSHCKLFFCDIEDSDEEFVFISKVHNTRFRLKKESIQASYAEHVYSVDTERHLLGGFAGYKPIINDANASPGKIDKETV